MQKLEKDEKTFQYEKIVCTHSRKKGVLCDEIGYYNPLGIKPPKVYIQDHQEKTYEFTSPIEEDYLKLKHNMFI